MNPYGFKNTTFGVISSQNGHSNLTYSMATEKNAKVLISFSSCEIGHQAIELSSYMRNISTSIFQTSLRYIYEE